MFRSQVEFRTLSQVVTLLKMNTRQAKAEGESSSGWTSLKKATKAKAFSNAGGDTLILIKLNDLCHSHLDLCNEHQAVFPHTIQMTDKHIDVVKLCMS